MLLLPTYLAISYCSRKLSLLVEDAKLLHDLRRHLRNHILDIDIVANRFLELSVANDQITFDKVVKVLREHNIELDRGVLSRWIKYSRGSASATCSIDKLTDILRRAADPLLEQLELEAWNNGKEVPRWGVAEIQKMSPSTTERCYCCH